MYNRERFISRTIDSVLNQDLNDFEIIVVDDGSADKSADAVRKYRDSRVRLICHEVNRGVGPARNTGLGEASGEWVICLDSDDELLPCALSLILARIKEVDENISRLQFMTRMDSGEISPDPPLKNEFWGYIEYIKWMERCWGNLSHSFQTIKRAALEEVKYYNDRTLETPFHLDFMKRFNARSFSDVVHIYHHDAANQLTRADAERSIQYAADQAASWERMLKNHGRALKLNAPRIYGSLKSNLATLFFLSGNRLKGVKYSLSCFAGNILSLRCWVILIVGLLGAKPLAMMKYYHARIAG
jgi:glycosyltransferase involved in cell wall biosynthesis